MKITFLGATETVTGSRYLIEHADKKVLVDCGLFQGPREIKERNWQDFPIAPDSIDAIVLTHAHIDHTGYIPVLAKKGFKGKVYCSQGTYQLCKILLKDSAFLQQEHAKKVNEAGYSRYKPALPLYTVKDAEYALSLFHPIAYDFVITIGGLQIMLIQSGHILGGSFVVITDGKSKITFSGDLGRPDQMLMKEPAHLKETDYLVLDSTYGDRLHTHEDFVQELGLIIQKTVEKKGTLIIPSFAVGRAQVLLYALYQLKKQNKIPGIPIFLDSPMAISVTDLYCDFLDEHKLSAQECHKVFDVATYVRTVSESKSLNHKHGPSIIIAGSGMADGGRVLHHFANTITNAKNTILFVGYQADGTKGRMLLEDIPEIKIYGKYYPVRATIKNIASLSAHADYHDILTWLASIEKPPKKIFLTHGDVDSLKSLQEKIIQRFNWSVVVPKYTDTYSLD
tara:strand:+ start:34 stop:1389 length:1356 start_codon:yes stop_codon:yes gene_type:complete